MSNTVSRSVRIIFSQMTFQTQACFPQSFPGVRRLQDLAWFTFPQLTSLSGVSNSFLLSNFHMSGGRTQSTLCGYLRAISFHEILALGLQETRKHLHDGQDATGKSSKDKNHPKGELFTCEVVLSSHIKRQEDLYISWGRCLVQQLQHSHLTVGWMGVSPGSASDCSFPPADTLEGSRCCFKHLGLCQPCGRPRLSPGFSWPWEVNQHMECLPNFLNYIHFKNILQVLV